MTWIPFALLLIAAVLAFPEAKREDGLIEQRNWAGEGDLLHGQLVWRRIRILGAWVAVFVALTCMVNWIWSIISWWAVVGMVPCYIAAVWASFTSAHRYRLNTLRKMDWRYIAPWGNATDRFWFGIVFLFTYWEWPDKNDLTHAQHYYPERGISCARVHRAGTISYIFELFILAISLGGAVWILNSGVGDPALPSGSTLQVLLRYAQSGLFTSIPIAKESPGQYASLRGSRGVLRAKIVKNGKRPSCTEWLSPRRPVADIHATPTLPQSALPTEKRITCAV